MYPWWQCLLFFCAIVCSDAYRERSLSNDSLNFQTIEKSISKTLLKLLQSDVQHPANPLPFWKLQTVSDVPSRYPISHQYRHLPRPQKWYNGRLIKRAVENPDKFMIAFKAAIKEAVRELLAEKEFSDQSNMANLWSKVNENTGGLPSDTEVNFLRSIGFHSEDTPSDYVHEPHPSLEYSTSEHTQGIQIWSTMRSLFTSKPEGTSVDLSNEQVSLKFQPDLQTQQSVTTLPSGTTQSFHHSNTTNAEKSKPYTEVTTAPSSSHLRPLTLSGSQSSETQESSNLITKDPFTMVTNPVLKSLTLGNILTSAENLNTAELPIIEKYTTDPDLVDLTVTISADLFSSARESLSPIKHSSSPIQHYVPQRDHTSNPNFMSANPYTKHDLPQNTFEDSRLSILTTNGKLADVDHIASSKEKLDPSLKMESTTVTAIRSDFSATQIYTPETSEITGNKEDPANTAGTLLGSTLSSTKHFRSTEGNIASTEAASFETNYEMLSTVTPLPIMGRDDPACILKVRNTTTTMQMPLTEQTTYENDRSVYLARIKTSLDPKTESFTSTLSPTELTSTVALSPFTDLYSTDSKEEDLSIVPLYLSVDTHFPEPTKLDPTETFSSFTDAYSASPEPTESPQTANLSLPDYDTFNDEINGNENSSQMTPDVTRTKRSTFLPFLFSKSLSMTTSWKSASPFNQTERFAALQTAANRQGFKSKSTTKNVQFYSSNHMTPQSQAISSESRVDFSVSQYATSSSTLNPFLTISQSRSQTTGKHLSSTRAPEASSKVWKSLSSVGPTSIIHAERSVAFQTAADRQDFNLSTMSSKPSIFYSSTYITPRSQTILSRTHMTSAVSQSVTSTALNALFTLQSRNKTTIRHSSTSTSEKPSQTSSPKIWKQQSSVAPSKSATSAIPPSRSTIFGDPPLRSTSDVFPPKSTSGAFPSKSSTFGAHTEKNASSLTITKRERYPTSTTTPKFSIIYSSTLISQQSRAIPSTTHGKFSLPRSVTYASTRKPLFTVSQSKTKTTPKSSTRTSAKTSETPGFKDWIPQASDVIPTKLATSVPAMDKGLLEIQTMPHATLSSTSAVGTVPLTFHLTGVSYSEQLSNHTTDEYKSLEKEVLLVLNKVFATKYQQEFVQAEILRFSKGSVVVISKVLFGSRSSTPSGSDIVRTVLSDDYATNNYFGWKINASTVECKGYTPRNLEQESLSISFVVLHFGFIAISQNYEEKHNYLESLQKEILRAINTSFQVTNISFLQIRDFHGDLEVRGILYLESSKFTNVQVLLSTLLPLANGSVDLRSITVEGMHNELKVYPFNFRITNLQFAVSLLDMASIESQKLSKDLAKVIELALHDKSLLQVVIQEFYGSVVCKGDLIYRFPAPGSMEVLRQFLQALTSDGTLGSSSYKVDFQSVTIDDSTSSPYNEYTDFPGFAVAIIVMCGLSILIFPSLVFVCYKTRMLGRRNKATIHQRHDPDQQSHHFEMDNRAFRASIEQP